METTDATPRARRRPRWGRRLLIAVLVLAIAIGALIVFLPRLATPFVKGAIAGAMPEGSTTEIAALRLGWSGAQRIDGLVVTDAEGDEIVNISASLDRGLLALARNAKDLGTIAVEGDLVLKPDAPGAAPAGTKDTKTGDATGRTQRAPARDFSEITAALDLTRLGVTVIDPEGGPDVVATIAGTGEIGPGTTNGLDLHADVQRAGERGSADIKITDVTWKTDASGALALEHADASVEATAVPVALLDGLAELDGMLGAVLGDTVTATARANAADGSYAATVDLDATGASLVGTVRVADNVLVAEGPIVAKLDTAGIARLPQVTRPLADAGVDLTSAPSAELRITDLRLPVPDGPFDPKTYDVRGASAVAGVELGAASARVPAELLGLEGAPRPVTTTPASFTLDLTDPGAGATLAGSIATMIDGRPAGSIAVDLRATGLLTETGAIRADALPALAGTLTASDVPAALLQPFVADTGLNLASDIGPTVTARLDAATPAPGDPTRATITATAARLSASATLVSEGTVVAADGPVEITLADPAPTLSRLLAESGVRVAQTGPAEIKIDNLRLDTAGLKQSPPDLRSVIADTTLRVGPITGAMVRAPEGDAPAGASIEFKIPRTAYRVALANDEAKITTAWGNLHAGSGRAAGRVEVDLKAGGVSSGAPTITGTISAAEVDPGALGSALGDPELARSLASLGPALDVTIRPNITPDATGAAIVASGVNADMSADVRLTQTGLAANADIKRLGTGVIDALAGKPGLAGAALGDTMSGTIALTATKRADGAIGAPLDATVQLSSPKARTTSPLRLRVTDTLAEVVGAPTLEATLSPGVLEALAGSQGGAPVTLVGATPARVTVSAFSVPLAKDTGAPFNVDVSLDTDPITLRARDGTDQRFESLSAILRTTDTPGQAQVKARLDEVSTGKKVISANLTADDLMRDGALDIAGSAVSGNLQLRDAPSGLIDAFAGTKGNAAQLLGPTTNARIDLQSFPREGGTTTVTAESPNATLEYAGVVRNGAVVSTKPAAVTLTQIQRDFGFKLASFMPVVGGVTKSASDRPAGITIPNVSIPLDLDPKKIELDMRADIGTAAIQLERGVAGLLDRRLVSPGGVRVGDSFKPFNVKMSGGVLRVTEFALPLGEFTLPADATFDLNTSTEDVVVKLPAGALLADSLGGDLGPLRSVLGTALNPPLRKRGPMGADNKWKIDPSWKAPETEKQDPGKQILEGLGGLLQRELNKDKDKDGG